MKSSRWLTYETRRAFIGGSDARVVMGGDEAALLRLWREKRGVAEPEDLSGNLLVQLGLAANGTSAQAGKSSRTSSVGSAIQ